MKNTNEPTAKSKKEFSVNKKTHRKFQAILSSPSTSRYFRRKKISISEKVVTDEDGFNSIERSTHHLLESRISLCAEALAYLYHLDGCAKNLLLYIISREVDLNTGRFPYNKQVADRFSIYCHSICGKKYSSETVKKAVKTLIDLNCMINVNRGSYFMNPMLVGGYGESHRRHLINLYTAELRLKGKAVDVNLFPKYLAN